MNSMEIDRRHFILGAIALTAWNPVPAHAFLPECTKSKTELLCATCRYPNGRFACIVITTHGKIVREVPLESRGHDITQHPSSFLTVVFARRPGTFALAFDPHSKAPPLLITTPPDRHFYGHGIFSSDGRLLFATENDFENAKGKIGIYDVTNTFHRIGEMESYGIGPHDILLLPDNKTLVVANGGIKTHPSFGRAKLNISTMSPSLSFIDMTTGDLLVQHELPSHLHQLSLRHIATQPDGTVWFGGQWEHDLKNQPSLIGSASLTKPLSLITQEIQGGHNLRGYIGSLALTEDGQHLAASAPRAGLILYLDTRTKNLVRLKKLSDGSGVAPVSASSFALTSGHGQLLIENPTTREENNVISRHTFAFDNHLTALKC